MFNFLKKIIQKKIQYKNLKKKFVFTYLIDATDSKNNNSKILKFSNKLNLYVEQKCLNFNFCIIVFKGIFLFFTNLFLISTNFLFYYMLIFTKKFQYQINSLKEKNLKIIFFDLSKKQFYLTISDEFKCILNCSSGIITKHIMLKKQLKNSTETIDNIISIKNLKKNKSTWLLNLQSYQSIFKQLNLKNNNILILNGGIKQYLILITLFPAIYFFKWFSKIFVNFNLMFSKIKLKKKKAIKKRLFKKLILTDYLQTKKIKILMNTLK